MPKAHAFTPAILAILKQHFGEAAAQLLQQSPLLGYLNLKTRSANQGSKARSSFANLYALRVVIHDYLEKGFGNNEMSGTYSKYEGARFSDLMIAQRSLPFGAKLQNHGLNSRLNEEFRKYYPTVEVMPIVRDLRTQRYWVNEALLLESISVSKKKAVTYNIAKAVLDILDAYGQIKRQAFEDFLATCRKISTLQKAQPQEAIDFIEAQLQPTVDARVFEIVSYAVLKAKYGKETVWIGDTREDVAEENLVLYKTGRTNANDGGIDFVMKPKGRFFQVTETVDMGKYFLDIDKVQRYPISFVVKSSETADRISEAIRSQATARYGVDSIVNSYMHAIEEIITTAQLIASFRMMVEAGELPAIMDEIIRQAKVEFNYEEVE
jgi:hypothetical protein